VDHVVGLVVVRDPRDLMTRPCVCSKHHSFFLFGSSDDSFAMVRLIFLMVRRARQQRGRKGKKQKTKHDIRLPTH
jgi:hypothetical protein